MIKTTGKWFLKTKDDQVVAFYHDHEENISPLERISEFDEGKFWSIDPVPELSGYDRNPEENSFFLVPKIDVVEVWFERYTEENKPKKMKSYNINDIMNKIYS